jgi:hypothetical protein
MNQMLRDRILRKLETLSDERLYQVLDFVEYLESKYAERQAPPSNVFTRFAEAVEDRMRAGRISTQTIAETMGLMNKAMGVLNGVAAAGKSVASDIVTATTRPPATPPTPSAPGAQAAAPVAPFVPPAPPAPPAPAAPGTAGASGGTMPAPDGAMSTASSPDKTSTGEQ